MRAFDFWKAVIMDGANVLEEFVRLLDDRGVKYCVIGGQGVNAYVEPLVSLDLDLVIAADQIESLEASLTAGYRVERFPHSINLSKPGSDLRIQLQTDPRYEPFLARAREREVLGVRLPVAAMEDVLQGKVWAAGDATRRGSKRQKDLADIARLIEAFPHLRDSVPQALLDRLG